MWVNGDEWDGMKRRLAALEALVESNQRLASINNEFVVDQGTFSPYALYSQYLSGGYIGRKVIPLAQAIQHLAAHIGAKFQKVEGTPETVIVVKEKK